MARVDEQPAFTAWQADREPDEGLDRLEAAYREADVRLQKALASRAEYEERGAHARADLVGLAPGKDRDKALDTLSKVELELRVLPDHVRLLARRKAETHLAYLHYVYLSARQDIKAYTASFDLKAAPINKKARLYNAYRYDTRTGNMTQEEAARLGAEVRSEDAEILAPLRQLRDRATTAAQVAQGIAEHYDSQLRLEGRVAWHTAVDGYAERAAASVKVAGAFR